MEQRMGNILLFLIHSPLISFSNEVVFSTVVNGLTLLLWLASHCSFLPKEKSVFPWPNKHLYTYLFCSLSFSSIGSKSHEGRCFLSFVLGYLSLTYKSCVVQRWYWMRVCSRTNRWKGGRDVIVPFWGPGLVFLLRIPMIFRGINCRYCLAQFSGSLPAPSEVQAWCQTCIIEELSAHPQWQRESLSILI